MASLHQIIENLRSGSRRVLTPCFLEISVMGHCNFECIQCHQLHHITTDHKTYEGQGPQRLSLDRAMLLLDEAKEMEIGTVEFCGRGEPTLMPELGLLIRRTKELGLKGSLITNGSHLTKALSDDLACSRFDAVTVSLYGATQESFANISRARGGVTLERIIENITYLKAVGTETTVTVAFLIQEEFLTGLKGMFDLIRSLHVDSYKFIVSLPYRNGIIGSDQQATNYANFAAALKESCSRFESGSIPQEFSEFVEYFLANPETDTIKTTYSRIPCYAGQWAIFVCDDGTVRPCSNSNWVLGSLYQSSLKEIWSGLPYQRFREAAATHILQTKTPLYRSYCTHCGWARTQTLIDEAVNDSNYKGDELFNEMY